MQYGCRVRGIYDVFRVPNKAAPYDVARMKVLYPAKDVAEIVPEADRSRAPSPVVVFLGATMVDSTRYQWLGERIVADTGASFISCETIGPTFMASLGPTANGKTTVDGSGCVDFLGALLEQLKKLNDESTLGGLLDLDRVVLGGHSVGARDAINNGTEELFPQVKGVFSYGAHTVAPTQFGYPPATILDMKGQVPLLLMGGSDDQVIMKVGPRSFGTEWKSPMEPIERTFREAMEPGRHGYTVEFEGFNHFSMVHPLDTTAGTAFLDSTVTINPLIVQAEFSRVLSLFVQETGFQDPKAQAKLISLADDETSLVKTVEHKP